MLAIGGLCASLSAAAPAAAQDTRPEFVIAAIGDSFSSGEGNPERPGDHDADGNVKPGRLPEFWGPTAGAQRCHRSPRAYSGVAAERLRARHPELRITFVHLGCSGASTLAGLLGADDGIDPPGPEFDIPAQVRKLNEFLNGRSGRARRIDALLVSIGVNDVGFGSIVGHCLSPAEGPCDQNRDVTDEAEDGLTRLVANLQMVEDSIAGRSDARLPNAPLAPVPVPNLAVPPLQAYLVEYPDPLRDENGDLCDGTQTDDPLYRNIVGSESAWLNEDVLIPMNGALQNAAANARSRGSAWSYLFGHGTAAAGAVPSFRNHGICASDSQRFMLENHEAIASQGADNDENWLQHQVVKTSNGAAHPNNAGHQAVADNVVAALEDQIARQLTPGRPTLTLRTVVGESVRRIRGRRTVIPGRFRLAFSAPPKDDASYRLTIRRERTPGAKKTSTVKVLPGSATTYRYSGTGLYTFSIRQCTPSGCSASSNAVRASNVQPGKLGRPTGLRRSGGQNRPPLPNEVDLLRDRTIAMRWDAPTRIGTEWSYFRVDFRLVAPNGVRGRTASRLTTTSDVTLGDFLNPLGRDDRYEISVRSCSNLGCSTRVSGPVVEAVRTPVAARR